MANSEYDSINMRIYDAADTLIMQAHEEDYLTEEDMFASCYESAIDKVLEEVKQDIKEMWGIM